MNEAAKKVIEILNEAAEDLAGAYQMAALANDELKGTLITGDAEYLARSINRCHMEASDLIRCIERWNS